MPAWVATPRCDALRAISRIHLPFVSLHSSMSLSQFSARFALTADAVSNPLAVAFSIEHRVARAGYDEVVPSPAEVQFDHWDAPSSALFFLFAGDSKRIVEHHMPRFD